MEAFPMLEEAITYFLARPFSSVWGGCQRAKKQCIGEHLQVNFITGRN
jgi:hypothetical protein